MSESKITAFIPVTAEVLEDASYYQRFMAEQMRRLTHPWEFPDRNPFPRIDPTPRLTRFLLRWKDRRQRWADAREVWRYGFADTATDRGWIDEG